jgi:ATP/ADP translocase
MNLYARLYVFVLGLAVLAFIINMVRTRRLQERYALLWLLAGLGLAVSPLVIHWLDRLAYALGFDYPPALLLILAVIALLLIILQLSLNISQNAEIIKTLTQEVGLLRQELDELKAQVKVEAEDKEV